MKHLQPGRNQLLPSRACGELINEDDHDDNLDVDDSNNDYDDNLDVNNSDNERNNDGAHDYQ